MTAMVQCYIEEYRNEEGLPSARLRQKNTGKKVDLGFVSAEERAHFLRFLSAMKQNAASIADVFSMDGTEDCIEVSGDLDFDSPDEIRFVPNESLQYIVA